MDVDCMERENWLEDSDVELQDGPGVSTNSITLRPWDARSAHRPKSGGLREAVGRSTGWKGLVELQA